MFKNVLPAVALDVRACYHRTLQLVVAQQHPDVPLHHPFASPFPPSLPPLCGGYCCFIAWSCTSHDVFAFLGLAAGDDTLPLEVNLSVHTYMLWGFTCVRLPNTRACTQLTQTRVLLDAVIFTHAATTRYNEAYAELVGGSTNSAGKQRAQPWRT